MTVPTYRVGQLGSKHVVYVTMENGSETACTMPTAHKDRAEQWARDLRRAAQVEESRQKEVRGER